MFRRTSSSKDATPAETVTLTKGPGAKGRPTPTRKEAQAAARERARSTMDKKAARKVLREKQNERQAQLRQAMRTGDERYLPKRDQGPVKRFVRDFVDARLSIAEFLLPLLVVIMVLQYSGTTQLVAFSNALWSTTLLVVAVDTVWLTFRLKRALRERFPDESLKGTTTYALLRVLQLRRLRMPKAQVRIGGAPKTPKA